MQARSTFLTFALALAAVPAIAGAQAFQYAPGTTRYRIETTANGTAQQMGMTQPLSYGSTQVVTVTIAPSTKDTLSLNVVLDSINGTTPQGMPIDPSLAKGVRVSARMSRTGRVYSRVVPDSLGAMAQAANQMADFFPQMPANVKVGSTWTDTTSGVVSSMGLDLKRTVVASFKVAGDTTVNGTKSWKVERLSNSTVEGAGNAMGQNVTVKATSKGTGAYYVTPAGGMLGADLVEQSNSTVTLTSSAMDITTDQKISSKVTRLP